MFNQGHSIRQPGRAALALPPRPHTEPGGPFYSSCSNGQMASPQGVARPFYRPCESKCCALENAGAWGSSLADLATPPFFYSYKVKP
jgi:hypothetical protein